MPEKKALQREQLFFEDRASEVTYVGGILFDGFKQGLSYLGRLVRIYAEATHVDLCLVSLLWFVAKSAGNKVENINSLEHGLECRQRVVVQLLLLS